MSGPVSITYNPSATFLKFHNDTSNVLGMGGPVGSGKSVGMVMHILLTSLRQQAHNGVRRTRWIVARATYSELKNTTIKTWSDWVPSSMGVVKMTAPPTTMVRVPDIGDGTALEMEVIFLALDREEDQEKLRSFEVTGIWFNEGQFVDEEVLRVGHQRTGRFPKVERDENNEPIKTSGPSWSGTLIDFNMPSQEHHLFKAFVTEKRKGWKLYTQPAAIIEVPDPSDPDENIWVGNPEAENITSLGNAANGWDGYQYYLSKVSAMTRSKILVDFCAKWGVSQTGQPVYAETFDIEHHVANKTLQVDKTLPVLMGIDFGLHPAIVFGQVWRDGTVVILRELDPNEPSGVSLDQFLSDWYRPFMVEHFNGIRSLQAWGDPAGRGRSALDKRTPFMMLKEAGINCIPAATNNYLPRKEAVEGLLLKRNGMLIDPSCKRLIAGYMGGYGYKKVNGLPRSEADKNSFSHVHDANQYLALGIVGYSKRKVVTSDRKTGVSF